MLFSGVSETFTLNENFWAGTLPDVFQDYERLNFFDVSNNLLTGPQPTTIFSVPTIRLLYMSNCSFAGTIPTSYADPPMLRDLFLDGNRITGTVPAIGPGQLEFLNEFLLQRTMITGTMPQSVCDLRFDHILDDLFADCGGENPEIDCDFPDCCNRCFEGGAFRRR